MVWPPMLSHHHKLTHHMQGQVLNQTSAWWMRHTEHITPNALLSVPDPNVAIMKKCKVLPIEFVVRGFMTGLLTLCLVSAVPATW